MTYDAAGNPLSQTDPLRHTRLLSYDQFGVGNGISLPQTIDPEAGNVPAVPSYSIGFDVNRNLSQQTDPKGRTTSFQYDQFNRQVGRTLPLGQTEHATFDGFGGLFQSVDFDGQTTEFQYDNLGRVSQRKLYPAGTNVPAETDTFGYNGLGQPTKLVDSSGATETTYDLDGRTTQLSTPEGVINYAYDPATGRKIRTWTVNTDTRYSYDQLGRLLSVTAVKRNGQVLNPPEVTTYAYTPVGNRASVVLPNGIQTLYSYDLLNRLTSLQHVSTNGTLLASFAYQYNAVNQRTNATEIVTGSSGGVHTNNISYAYDELNRLIQEKATDAGDGSGYQASYVYDLVGNRLSRALTTAGKTLTTYYSYDANDRLLMESNVVSTASSGSGMIQPRMLGPDGQPLPAFDPQFAKVSYYTLKAIPYGLLAAFILPAAMTLLRRRNRPAVLTLDLNPQRALLPRCLSGLLAALMLLMGFDLNVMADQAVYYTALNTDTWGLDGSVTTYQYDANGSVIQKVTTGPKPETVIYQ